MIAKGESKRITLGESYDSSNYSSLMMDTRSFVVFLWKAFSEGSKGSTDDDFQAPEISSLRSNSRYFHIRQKVHPRIQA
jgi:hypothetical protein